MTRVDKRLRVAVVQDSPVFLNRTATVDKCCDLIARAAGSGAELVVFPEAFIPGYPDWIWLVPGNRKPMLAALYRRLVENAVSIPGESTDRLCEAAREHGVAVVVGVNELNTEASHGTLYNTLVYIGSDGTLLGRHRKLMPTGAERTVWGQGRGDTLTVYPLPFARLGGLICWENLMPLARQALYNNGVQVLVAATWDSSDVWQASMRHIGREGGTFVVSCCTALRVEDVPAELEFRALYPEGREWINRGMSCVVNPAGRIIAGPLEKAKDILYAELDLTEIPASKWMFDAAGHYARTDVFDFSVRSKR